MNILVTGAKGFIGQNLCVHLEEAGFESIETITRDDNDVSIDAKVRNADFIYHLAGINRPKNDDEFKQGNTDLTQSIVDILIKNDCRTPVVLTSSIQAELNNPYGISKADAEVVIKEYRNKTGADTYIYRLPNVFGKWCKPNYNSVVATFCYNTINNLPIIVHNADAELNLVYIDDVCRTFVGLLTTSTSEFKNYYTVEHVHKTTVGEVVSLLSDFKQSRTSLITNRVGVGFERALYSTYLSYFKPEQFTYDVPSYTDERGSFSEMLKTKDSGQFSFFTAHPGITRGGHYHHSKNEKFLVLKGEAHFKFKHIVTGEEYEVNTSETVRTIVETVPGWSHDITNIGSEELLVLLWANEIFDRETPDTVAMPL
ncbi:NAD-dependent epimerase/dehydratase family protein [Pseudoalteromonas sp. K222D]|uniref:UDP-2-acetamido-2,6-beta-L-arabino-hexul-4-ose reductase n=1 Tax=Pseudoalteromonas sp. K222D TaxID=2820756 RepID=UPI001AD66447|nr:NAD-dependent epimerase/dehydratase family protein [Pseudoalteromonas sp. K222D]MBO7926568.1 NAD-dependent epimerase/dehydratase family protein [Pseudoalteromonas sp. K222D]